MGTPIAFVIHPELRHAPSSRPADLMLEEACLLANAIGLEVVHSEVIALAKLRAGSYFGKGVTERLGDLAEDFTHDIDAPVVIINTSLSPVQQRNLETQIKAKVIDRTQLILEIFGARAQTHAGRLQVELAALSFQRSRLVRSWTHLERQRGGSFLGGPGERQIELDRRMLMDRVTRIKAELKEVTRTRTLQRSNRLRSETPTFALIGYTNAGKSTLFNRLTGADVLSKDMLFATLDPTMRELDFVSGRKVVLADTVGFISQLPTELVEAFKSTLEEVVHADVLIHVHDASSPLVAEEAADVVKVLGDLGMDAETQAARILHVLNKADLLAADDEQVASLQNMFPDGVFVSAKTGDGVDDLLAHLDRHLGKSAILATIYITPTDGAARAWLYQNAMVKSSHFDNQGHEQILVSIDQADHARLCARWPDLGVLRAEA
ncbi:GTPase HflX [Alphaproteobacteria bacterium]|nr:GTPase HflX [Alphaproteobacteria bacterium]